MQAKRQLGYSYQGKLSVALNQKKWTVALTQVNTAG